MKLSKTWLGAWIVCTLLGAWLPRAQARPLRALVCVESGVDGALLERVRGQTGDLAVRLVPRSCGLGGDFDAQLARAQEVAAARRADLAVWFVRRAARLVVYVAEPASERVLARRLDEGAGPHAASARDEAAALVVRSAVRAALAGAALDTPAAERAAAVTAPATESAMPEAPPAPAAAPPPTPAPAPPPPAAEEEPARRPSPRARRVRARRVEPWLAARAQGALDGFAPRGRYGLGGRVGVRSGWLEVGVAGLAGLRTTRDVALGRLTLARHRFGAYGAFALLARDAVRLALEVEAGAEVAQLRVQSAGAGLRPSASRALIGWVGAQLRLSYAPRWSGGRFAIGPSLGLVVMPERPLLGYRDDGVFVPVRRVYAVEPVLDLMIAVRL